MTSGSLWMRAFGAMLIGAGLLLASGCEPKSYSGPTGTVSGKVTLAGEPAPTGCLVTFIADTGQVASGKVGAGGAYQLSAGGKPQIPAVKYKATVTAPAAAEMSAEEYDKMMSGKGEAPKQADAPKIPTTYATTTTSGLSYEVKAGANEINIELK